MTYFMESLAKHYPGLIPRYNKVYKNSGHWGVANQSYYQEISKRFYQFTKKYHIPARMPPYIFQDILDLKDRVIVILEHLDYLLRLRQQNSSYGYSARSISKLKEPIENLSRDQLLGLKGVGRFTANIIREIIETGRCSYYEKLLYE